MHRYMLFPKCKESAFLLKNVIGLRWPDVILFIVFFLWKYSWTTFLEWLFKNYFVHCTVFQLSVDFVNK